MCVSLFMIFGCDLWVLVLLLFWLCCYFFVFFFFFQAEDGIRDLVRSRGLGDVYKRQAVIKVIDQRKLPFTFEIKDLRSVEDVYEAIENMTCLLYTSDAADDLLCVDLGGRRIIKKKKTRQQ
mgnify:CR=1 FL=1